MLVVDLDNPSHRRKLIEIIREAMPDAMDAAPKVSSPGEKELLDTKEAMSFLGISGRVSMHRYHKLGLPYVKGSPNKYLKSDLIKFLNTQKICLQ